MIELPNCPTGRDRNEEGEDSVARGAEEFAERIQFSGLRALRTSAPREKKSGWATASILFLAERNMLANQAYHHPSFWGKTKFAIVLPYSLGLG